MHASKSFNQVGWLPIVGQFVYTQKLSIKDQLELGVRSFGFDLECHDGQWLLIDDPLSKDLATGTIDDFLYPVQEFIKRVPKTVIFVFTEFNYAGDSSCSLELDKFF